MDKKTIIILVSVVSGVAILFGSCCVVGIVFWAIGDASQKSKAIPRQEFVDKIMGKTPDEVVAILGKPDLTTEDSSSKTWFYNFRTIDPVNGRIDSIATVTFERNHVKRVRY